jgi:UDP-2-acetamido-2,6-beta-L-arabino-hexul-4-ose reductase
MAVFAVTGANGFVGKNLRVRLGELGHHTVAIPRDASPAEIAGLLQKVEFVFHLAGVNRPQTEDEFVSGNVGMTQRLVAALSTLKRSVPVLFASSIQAERDNPYGRSKRAAEEVIERFGAATGTPVYISRLANVFGKWCRPNYNSAVATFCHNIARDLPVSINDPSAPVRLVYIDDVVQACITCALSSPAAGHLEVGPVYETTVGALAAQIEAFRNSRTTLITGAVGTGFLRALHATYVSYLEPKDFAYPLTAHSDARGMFTEMLRTPDSGQFSFFTAHPGITRGGHYHHTKTEKFLVVQGRARFGFRQIVTGETFELMTSGDQPQVVETIPGWAHDITNVGHDTMVVMLWANELFDRDRPDTVAANVLDA